MKIAFDWLKLITVSIIFMTLYGCGFAPQKLSDFPKPLHTLYFNADNPNGRLATEVRRRLKALHFYLVDSPTSNTIELHLTKAVFSSDQPVRFYSGYAQNYSYRLSVSYQLLADNKPLTSGQSISLTQNQLHNTNQTYTSGARESMRINLTQQVADQLLLQLSSPSMRKLFSTKHMRHHVRTAAKTNLSN